MMRTRPWFLFGFCLLFIAPSISLPDVRTAGIFGDGMVLQLRTLPGCSTMPTAKT